MLQSSATGSASFWEGFMAEAHWLEPKRGVEEPAVRGVDDPVMAAEFDLRHRVELADAVEQDARRQCPGQPATARDVQVARSRPHRQRGPPARFRRRRPLPRAGKGHSPSSGAARNTSAGHLARQKFGVTGTTYFSCRLRSAPSHGLFAAEDAAKKVVKLQKEPADLASAWPTVTWEKQDSVRASTTIGAFIKGKPNPHDDAA